jgi:type II secretory ATPase GspE/PulE/Tfp pilus assembly ATPase PilB-like protein
MNSHARESLIFDVERGMGGDADPTLVWESIIHAAVRARVSDIHVLSHAKGHELAFRLDGDIRRQGMMSNEFGRHLIGHVKSIANIDVADRRHPGDGRMKMEMPDQSENPAGSSRLVDLRISTVPTIYGEDLVARVFDHRVSLMELGELGMLPEQLDLTRDMLHRPHGLLLVSGPSGAGKTTTLYAMLQYLAGSTRKINTIEDPVEYDLPGVNQTQVHQRINVTFAAMLTAILRQDPDVIMVGEIRDTETAVTAVRAANTGNLVLATTHATRSARAVETMLSLGVHPYFLAVALRGVIAQVLVKRVCPECRQPLPETADMVIEPAVRKRLGDEDQQLHIGRGCEHCYGTGYHGRVGLFEQFIPDEKIKQLILDQRPVNEIDQAIRDAELLTLEQSGKLAALRGQTTMEELVRTLPSL